MNKDNLREIFFCNCNFFNISENAEYLYNKFIDYFEIAKDGNPTFKISNRYLYSRYKPYEKFERLDFTDKNNIIFIDNLVGLSISYFLNKIYSEKNKPKSFFIFVFTSFYSFLFSLFIVEYFKLDKYKTKIIIYNNKDKEILSLDTVSNLFNKLKQISNLNGNDNLLSFFDNTQIFEMMIEKFFQSNFNTVEDLKSFKLFVENVTNASNISNIFIQDIYFIQKLVKVINNIYEKYNKSFYTEKFFSKIWEKNISKNIVIIKEKKWNLSKIDFEFDYNNKKGIILWGASSTLEDFLDRLSKNDIKLINKYYYSIAITSSTKLLKEFNINIDFQAIFDAGIFAYFNIDDYSTSFILSMLVHPAIFKKINYQPYIVNLLTEEEKMLLKDYDLPAFPFYGATLPTLYTKFYQDLIKNNLIDYFKLYMIGSSFDGLEKRTHHYRYPLYTYVISKFTYFNTALKWETSQKIINLKKFKIYKESLKNLNILKEEDLLADLTKLSKLF